MENENNDVAETDLPVAKNDFLEKLPVGKLMRMYAVPNMIAMVTAALYNIVDQLFIANADYLGSYGNAANTVVYPLTVVALAFAVMVGDGACTFIGLKLGAGDSKNASKAAGGAVTLSVLSGIIIMLLYFIFSDSLLSLFGGKVNAETYSNAKEYFFWITVGIPFYVFGQAMNSIIRADGSPKFAMIATLAGAVTNIVLDPIFIFPMKMGMAGAAIATILGQILTAVLSCFYLFKMKAIKLHKDCFIPDGKVVGKSLFMGLTSFLSQFSLVVSMAAVQTMITKYGALDPVFGIEQYKQIPLAVLGIVMKYFGIAIAVAVGLAAGCIPVVSYNMGAGRKDRASEILTKMIISELIVGFIGLIGAEIFPQQIADLFGAANESEYYSEFAVKCFRIYLCMMPLATLNKGTFIYLQGLGKPVLSTSLAMTREIIMGVSLPIILPVFFGLDGVLYSFPAADILTFIFALILIIITYRQLSGAKKKARIKTAAEKKKIFPR